MYNSCWLLFVLFVSLNTFSCGQLLPLNFTFAISRPSNDDDNNPDFNYHAPSSFDWTGTKDLSDDVHLSWKLFDHDSITIKLVVDTSAWIAIGWNPDAGRGEMTDADMAVLSKVGAELKLRDMWSTGFVMPVVDDQDDLRDKEFGQDDSHTWLQFTRSLETGNRQDKDISSTVNFIIWAYGDSNEFSYHKRHRGHTFVDFSGNHGEERGNEDDDDHYSSHDHNNHEDKEDYSSHDHNDDDDDYSSRDHNNHEDKEDYSSHDHDHNNDDDDYSSRDHNNHEDKEDYSSHDHDNHEDKEDYSSHYRNDDDDYSSHDHNNYENEEDYSSHYHNDDDYSSHDHNNYEEDEEDYSSHDHNDDDDDDYKEDYSSSHYHDDDKEDYSSSHNHDYKYQPYDYRKYQNKGKSYSGYDQTDRKFQRYDYQDPNYEFHSDSRQGDKDNFGSYNERYHSNEGDYYSSKSEYSEYGPYSKPKYNSFSHDFNQYDRKHYNNYDSDDYGSSDDYGRSGSGHGYGGPYGYPRIPVGSKGGSSGYSSEEHYESQVVNGKFSGNSYKHQAQYFAPRRR